MQSDAFYSHLKDAIEINKERKKIYAKNTNNQSTFISNFMILSEQMLLPVAKYFDWKGKKFNAVGIPIVINDFVSMDNIKSVHEEPAYKNSVSEAHLKQLTISMREFKKLLIASLEKYQFEKTCEATENMINTVSSVESLSCSHFSMLKHLLESIGYASVNAVNYSKSSCGKTKKLSKQLIMIQANGLTVALKIDLQAQKIQALGEGIIVNDVPVIPFLSQWHAVKNTIK